MMYAYLERYAKAIHAQPGLAVARESAPVESMPDGSVPYFTGAKWRLMLRQIRGGRTQAENLCNGSWRKRVEMRDGSAYDMGTVEQDNSP